VYDEEAVKREELQKIARDKANKGKTRTEMGLDDFKGTEIRSTLMGITVNVTEEVVAKAVRCISHGMFMVNTKKKSDWAVWIFQTMHADRQSDKNNDGRNWKVVSLSSPQRLSFNLAISKICLESK